MKYTHKRQKIETANKKKKRNTTNNQFGIDSQNSSYPSANTWDQPGNSNFMLLTLGINLPCRNYTALITAVTVI